MLLFIVIQTSFVFSFHPPISLFRPSNRLVDLWLCYSYKFRLSFSSCSWKFSCLPIKYSASCCAHNSVSFSFDGIILDSSLLSVENGKELIFLAARWKSALHFCLTLELSSAAKTIMRYDAKIFVLVENFFFSHYFVLPSKFLDDALVSSYHHLVHFPAEYFFFDGI